MVNIVRRSIGTVREAAKNYLTYSYYDSIYLQWFFNHSHRLEKFKNIHNNQSCFIIGNGPSLNKMDLSCLRYYHCFGLNKIYLLLNKVDLELSYHVAVNPLVIEQSIKEFKLLKCPSFLSYKAAHNLSLDKKNNYFIATGNPCAFQTDLTQRICEGYTVTYVAMQIAFYMGFNKVFLIGVDHNFKAIGNPNEKQFLKGNDPNHFASNYFANQEWHLPDLEGSELFYHLAKFYFNRDGRQIYDATVDGKLQIFPKISYEQALSMCSRK